MRIPGYASWRRRRLYRRCLAAPHRTVILRYHSVGDPAAVAAYLDPGLSLPPERFREQVRQLARRCEFALPAELPRRLAAGPPPRPVVVLTFDDGYRDNHAEALPILREEGARAAFYVTTGPLRSGRGLWISELHRLVPRLPGGTIELAGEPLEVPAPARRRPLQRGLTRRLAALTHPERERALDQLAAHAGLPRGEGLGESFMTPDHLRELDRAGMAVGAHTRGHPHLDRLSGAHHDEEVRGSREDLEEILGRPVTDFAYPNPGGGGRVEPPARQSAAAAGFLTAVTSVPRPLGPESDLLRLPRLGVYAGDQERLLFGLLAQWADA
jgi:peptidoglycan/xylan/chitin deacetylase (PgdA/CDA1 family)